MNKLYPVFMLLLLSAFVVGCSWLVKPESNQRTTEQIKKSVVRIKSNNRQGTGFVVGVSDEKAYIITVSHVIEGDPKPTIEFFGNQEFNATVLSREPQENGLALLSIKGRIPDEAIPLYLVKQRDLKDGDTVFTFGFPRGVTSGTHDALSYSGQKMRNLLFSDSDIKEGNSGSPVIKGEQVVAVITSITDFAYAMSVESIREFLRGAKGGETILNDMEKWNITTWRKEYQARLAKARQKQQAESELYSGLAPSFVEDAIIVFSNDEGDSPFSINGNERNSLYTKYLLDAMQISGRRIEEMFTRVRKAIQIVSGGLQNPWHTTSLKRAFVWPKCSEEASNSCSVKPIALVIGNAHYQHAPLTVTRNNAIDIADVLVKRCFDVTLKTDLDYEQMKTAIREFNSRLFVHKGVGLFYFSGHGVQFEGNGVQLESRNYLIPIDNGRIRLGKRDLPRYSVSVEKLLQNMEKANNGSNIIILDTPPLNPFNSSVK